MVNLLSPAEIQYENAHIADNEQPAVIAAISIAIVVGWVSVGLRFLARWKSRSSVGWDDYLIVVALLVTTAATVAAGFMVKYGLGRHMILAQPQGFSISVIVCQVLYNTSLPIIKISVLCLYNRLFPSRRLYHASLGIGAFIIAYITVQAICIITQCLPISSFWTGEPATCINFAVVLMICSILNIITDLIILALPIPFLWKLKVSRTQRLQLFGTFALGGLVTLITVLRTVLVAIPPTADMSWSDVPPLVVSMVEINVGVLSACLPTYRPLLRRRATKTPTGSSQQYASGSQNGEGKLVRALSGKRGPRPMSHASVKRLERDHWIALGDIEEGLPSGEAMKEGHKFGNDSSSTKSIAEAAPPPPPKGNHQERLRAESPMGIVVTTDVSIENRIKASWPERTAQSSQSPSRGQSRSRSRPPSRDPSRSASPPR